MSEIVYYGVAAIQVGSTVYGANAVQTTNVIVSGNVTVSQFLGVGGFAVTTGCPTVGVTGNVYASNALTTTNVFATNVFATTVNVIGSVTASTFYGALAGSNTASFSNIYSANAVTTTNLFANTLTLANASSTINVIGSVTASTFYGAHAGSNTGTFSNIYSANAVTTTNLFANTLTLANATSTINVIGSVTASTFYGAHAGSNTGTFSNIYSANAVTTTNVYASNIADQTGTFGTTGQVLTKAAAGTLWAAPAISSQWTTGTGNIYYLSNVGIGTSTVSANLSVTGNAYVSNALTTTNLFANTLTLSNATSTINVLGSVTASTFYGALAGSNTGTFSNIYSANSLTTANIFVTGNVNVQGISNLYVANIATANVSTLNVSSISVSGSTATPGYVLSATSLGLAWIAAGSSQWSGAAGNPIYYGPNVGIGTLSAPPASGSNLFVQGNVFVSNSITVSNIVATGTISGTWTGTNQGILLTLGTSLTGVANFATSSDTPTLQAFHVPLQSFAQSTGFVSLFSVTAQGLIKFTSTGLYQITTVLAMNAPISRIAVGTNTSSTFPSVTNAYTYVYIIPSGTSPSAVITIPINVQNTGLWYYLDVFTQSSTTTASFYATASATITGSQFGTYVQIAPFGNYTSSVGSQAAGLLVTPSTTVTLSSPITSNTYHVRMTSAANWTTSGASSSMQISTNGNLQFYQAGLYEVKVCLNATLYAATQFAIGSSASDSSLPSTQGPYVYQYAPNYTQDPSTAVVLPLNITDTTKFYYLDVSFPGSTTTVSVLPTSTFVSVAPIGSFIPTPMATASIVVAGVATALTGTYVATSADTYIGFTGGGTVTLPLGSTLTRGKTYTIKDESGLAGTNTTNLIKIQMSGTDLLDGYSSVTIQLNYAGLNVVWTGANSRWSFI